MAIVDSTVRLRQMNQPELSGFIALICSGILANSGTYVAPTGKLTGAFYPLPLNPSGYLRSGAFLSQADLDAAIAQQNAYIANTYYLLNNPSGFINNSGVVRTTGNQTIQGVKTFSGAHVSIVNPDDFIGLYVDSIGADGDRYFDMAAGTVNWGGGGTLAIDLANRILYDLNDSASLDWMTKNLYGLWTGQTFTATTSITSPEVTSSVLLMTPLIRGLDDITAINVASRTLYSTDGYTPTLDWSGRKLIGNWDASGLTIRGNPIFTGQLNTNQIVWTTGDQTIDGNKGFVNTVVALGFVAADYDIGIQAANYYWGGREIGLANGYLIDSTNGITVDWGNQNLRFNNSDIRVDWKNRRLSGVWDLGGLTISGQPFSGGGGSFVDDGTFVRTTGDQTIAGAKTFNDNLETTLTASSSYLGMSENGGGQLWFLDAGGLHIPYIENTNGGVGQVDGNWNFNNILTVSGHPVSTGNSYLVDDGTFVRTTGNQFIGGIKGFTGAYPTIFTTGIHATRITRNASPLSYTVIDVTGNVLNWSRSNLGQTTEPALDWQNHTLIDKAQGVSLDWDARGLSGNWTLSGKPLMTGTPSSYVTTGLVTGRGNVTVSMSGNYLQISGSGSSFTDDGTFVRTTGTQLVTGSKKFDNINANRIYGSNNNDSIDFTVHGIYDSGYSSINWSQRILYSGNATASVDWKNHLLVGDPYTTTLDWYKKQLSGTWDAGGLTVQRNPVVTGGPYALTGHTHTGYVTSGDLTNSGLATTGWVTTNFAPTGHTHTGYVTSGALGQSGFATSGWVTGWVTTGFSPTGHTHTGYVTSGALGQSGFLTNAVTSLAGKTGVLGITGADAISTYWNGTTITVSGATGSLASSGWVQTNFSPTGHTHTGYVTSGALGQSGFLTNAVTSLAGKTGVLGVTGVDAINTYWNGSTLTISGAGGSALNGNSFLSGLYFQGYLNMPLSGYVELGKFANTNGCRVFNLLVSLTTQAPDSYTPVSKTYIVNDDYWTDTDWYELTPLVPSAQNWADTSDIVLDTSGLYAGLYLRLRRTKYSAPLASITYAVSIYNLVSGGYSTFTPMTGTGIAASAQKRYPVTTYPYVYQTGVQSISGRKDFSSGLSTTFIGVGNSHWGPWNNIEVTGMKLAKLTGLGPFLTTLDWGKHALYDSTGATSLDWSGRQLSGNWKAGNLDVKGVVSNTTGPLNLQSDGGSVNIGNGNMVDTVSIGMWKINGDTLSDSAGLLGVGVANPIYPIEVVGTVSMTGDGSTPALMVAQNNADYTNTDGAGSHIKMINTNANAQTVIGSYLADGSLLAKWRTDYVGNTSWVSTAVHDFYIGGDYPGGTEALALHQEGILLWPNNIGNVGIRNPSPQLALDVNGDIGNSLGATSIIGSSVDGFGGRINLDAIAGGTGEYGQIEILSAASDEGGGKINLIAALPPHSGLDWSDPTISLNASASGSVPVIARSFTFNGQNVTTGGPYSLTTHTHTGYVTSGALGQSGFATSGWVTGWVTTGFSPTGHTHTGYVTSGALGQSGFLTNAVTSLAGKTGVLGITGAGAISTYWNGTTITISGATGSLASSGWVQTNFSPTGHTHTGYVTSGALGQSGFLTNAVTSLAGKTGVLLVTGADAINTYWNGTTLTVSGAAGTVANAVYTSGIQTITGYKNFQSGLAIPFGASPVNTGNGTMAFDTTDGQLYMGSGTTGLVLTRHRKTFTFTLEKPTTEFFPMYYSPCTCVPVRAITTIMGTTVALNVDIKTGYDINNSASFRSINSGTYNLGATACLTGSSFTGLIPAGGWLTFVSSVPSSSVAPDMVTFSLEYIISGV